MTKTGHWGSVNNKNQIQTKSLRNKLILHFTVAHNTIYGEILKECLFHLFIYSFFIVKKLKTLYIIKISSKNDNQCQLPTIKWI